MILLHAGNPMPLPLLFSVENRVKRSFITSGFDPMTVIRDTSNDLILMVIDADLYLAAIGHGVYGVLN